MRTERLPPNGQRRLSIAWVKPAHFRIALRACFKIPWGPVFAEKAGWRGATREDPRSGAVTEEQRSQPAFSAKTLRAAVLLSAARVGEAVTARCGDAPASPPWPQPKSLAAGPHGIFRQALSRTNSVAKNSSASTPARSPVESGPHDRCSALLLLLHVILISSVRVQIKSKSMIKSKSRQDKSWERGSESRNSPNELSGYEKAHPERLANHRKRVLRRRPRGRHEA